MGYRDIEIQAKEILYTKQQINQRMVNYTGQSLERIEEDTERDFYMSAQEAVEYGLIDQVIDPWMLRQAHRSTISIQSELVTT